MVTRIQQRYVIVFMLFLSTLIGVAQREVLPITITAMVHVPEPSPENKTLPNVHCQPPDWIMNSRRIDIFDINESENSGIKFDWSVEEQGFIVSSFFIGYIVTHVPGGLMAQEFGGKIVIAIALFASGVLTLVSPAAVRNGDITALIAIRVSMGLFQGTLIPSFAQLLAEWVPTVERAFLGSIAWSGVTFGFVTASFFSGLIMHYYNWEMVFYIFGTLGIACSILVMLLCYNNPAWNPFITISEKVYLLHEIGQMERDAEQPATPWKDIFTCKPVWALILTWVLSNWSYAVESIILPNFLNNVPYVNIRDVGVFHSIPWISQTVLSYIFGYAIDWLIARRKISITRARKLTVVIASILPALFIVIASYAGCNLIQVVIFCILSISMRGFLTASLLVNPMDLTPNYAGVLMGIVNGAGVITEIIAPYTVEVLSPNSNLFSWRLAFWMLFIMYVIVTAIFSFWGSGQKQWWDKEKTEDDENDDERTVEKLIY